MTLVRRRFLAAFEDLSLVPGTGAGALGTLISLLLGRGEKFLVLLDDDRAGIAAAERYRDEWLLDAASVQTLGELDARQAGKKLEGLFSDETKRTIATHFGLAGEPTKKQIGLYLAEMCRVSDADAHLSEETTDTIRDLLNRLKSHLGL